MRPPPPASPVRDAWVVLPAALVLLLVLTSFTLLTYRNGVRAPATPTNFAGQTGAFESAVANLVSPGERHLVVSAGSFGERWEAMTTAFGVTGTAVPSSTDVAESPPTRCTVMRCVRRAGGCCPSTGNHI